MDRHQRLRELYDAFNRRDVDAVLAAFASDVDWPNGWEGGRVLGHDEVRGYWTRQFQAIHPSLRITEIADRPDGRTAVQVDQIVHDLDGHLLNESHLAHVYAFDDEERITRMDIEEEPRGEA